jgi:hypothetical protein
MKQTPDLEAVVRRYNEASEALEAARADLQTAAVAALQGGAKQADIARATGWSREHLRRLREKAEAEAQKTEMEALRKKVEELSAPASAPPKETRPAVAAPRQQVTQAVPEPPEDDRPVLTDNEARDLVATARRRGNDDQRQRLHRTSIAAEAKGTDPDLDVIEAAFEMGLLTDADIVAVREQLAAEQPRPAVDATEES